VRLGRGGAAGALHPSIELGGSAQSRAQILLDALLAILGRTVRFAVTVRLAAGEPILILIASAGRVLAFKI